MHIKVYAIIAYPYVIPYIVNGDTVFINLKGDENCKYALDEYGHTLLSLDSEWVYACEDSSGNVVPSKYPVISYKQMSEDTSLFLQSVKKGIVPMQTAFETSRIAGEKEIVHKVKAIGTRKALVILMQFKDVKFTKEPIDFDNLFNEKDYREDGALGSVYDYYKWASYGQLDLHSDIMGPYTAEHDMAFYGANQGAGGNDRNPYTLFSEAINYVVHDVDLTDYDLDGDGFVDNIHIIFAGYGEEAGASSNAIWAHEMSFRPITINGMKIDRYSCAPELRGNNGKGICRIGPHCHEIGHALGAMDYYDTDYETGGGYQGTGKWDIMASGSWNDDGIAPADFNPYVKIYDFGWTEANTMQIDTINVIKPSSQKDAIYRINTGVSKDFFLLENRNGEYFHSAEPGTGLLIFHVGPNLESRSATNTINSTYPQQCYVVCASSTFRRPSGSPASYGNISSAGTPYPGTSGNAEFGDSTIPAALTVSGQNTGIFISDIKQEGENITLYYTNRNVDSQDDTPDIPDETYLWAEDFEQLRLPASWEYSNEVGEGEFSVTTKLSNNDLPNSPLAASGMGYAQFVPKPRMVIGEYRTVGRVLSQRIHLASDAEYQMSFYIRKYNKGSSKDFISLLLHSDEALEPVLVLQEEVVSQNSWERHMIKIPENCRDFSIEIICDADYGSVIFVDCISLSKYIEDTRISTTSVSTADRPVSIYSLSGSKQKEMNRGLNIVILPDGKICKIFVRY